MLVIAKTVIELNTFVYAASSWLVGRLPLSETARLTSVEKGPLDVTYWTNCTRIIILKIQIQDHFIAVYINVHRLR